MSSKSAVQGKSPYARSNASRRGRGGLLVATVVILLLGALAWTTVYTRAVEHSGPVTKQAAPDR